MILKDFTAPNTGATANCHVIQRVTLDYSGTTWTTALIASYLSQEAFNEGLFPLYMQEIKLDGLPPTDQDPRDYAGSVLVQAAPDDTANSGNRYTFAGGTIADSTPSTSEDVATPE